MLQNKHIDFNKRTPPTLAPSAPVRAPSNGPVASWKAGGLQVAIWENQSQTADGQVGSYHTVSFERRYKDKSGEWKSTNSLRTNDLPKAIVLLNRAYEALLLGEDNGEHDE